ncbi:MAG: class I SAM-dependent methyltransferase [Syntrophomonadaceae bacterium]|nr:class I SAM-dependent methyltransferase [Syntrophomonadaceae bacterium]
MNKELLNWEKTVGITFLRDIGVKEKDVVIDFGCGAGFYCISAAFIVGAGGKVYAIDKSGNGFRSLRDRYSQSGLKNIEMIKTNGELDLNLQNEIADVALLYDVLHYFSDQNRKNLIKEMRRLLKKEAILSIHPTHLKTTAFKHLINEIVELGFDYKGISKGNLIHYNFFEVSLVYNFKRA